MAEETQFDQAKKGIFLALAAAYLYALLIFWEELVRVVSSWESFSTQWGWTRFFILPGFALLLSFWIVIPSGAFLGVFVPRLAHNRTPLLTALMGAGLGFFTGLAIMFAAMLTLDGPTFLSSNVQLHVTWSHFWWEWMVRVIPQSTLAGLYGSIWVGGYAYYTASRDQSDEQQGSTTQ